jgi:NADPH-dependent glutamate synthase beta subunit-like oxidoreductase
LRVTIQVETAVTPTLGRRVLLYSGDNTTLDVARTAKRRGASKTLIIYWRTREKMPAQESESVDGDTLLPALGQEGDLGMLDGLPGAAIDNTQAVLEMARRLSTLEEVIGGLHEPNAAFEARRCLSCGNCHECDNCYEICPEAVLKLGPGKRYKFRRMPLRCDNDAS